MSSKTHSGHFLTGWNWEKETQKKQENQSEMQVGTSGTLDQDWSREDGEKQLDSNLV